MKILVVSDTHGNHKNLDRVLDKEKDFDLFIHLGDLEGGEDYIEAVVSCPIEMVMGNNDFFSDLVEDKEIQIGHYKVYITHGYRHHVAFGLDHLRQQAMTREADIVLFGHTHRPYIEETSRYTLANPGSLTSPRQEGKKPSYLLMELDAEGKMHYFLKYLD